MQPATLKIILKYMVGDSFHKEANFYNNKNSNIRKFDELVMITSDISKEFLKSDEELKKFLSKLENKAKDRKPRAASYFAFLLLLKLLRSLSSGRGVDIEDIMSNYSVSIGLPPKLAEVYTGVRAFSIDFGRYKRIYGEEKKKESEAKTPEEKETHKLKMEEAITKYKHLKSELPILIEEVKSLVQKIISKIQNGSEPKEEEED